MTNESDEEVIDLTFLIIFLLGGLVAMGWYLPGLIASIGKKYNLSTETMQQHIFITLFCCFVVAFILFLLKRKARLLFGLVELGFTFSLINIQVNWKEMNYSNIYSPDYKGSDLLFWATIVASIYLISNAFMNIKIGYDELPADEQDTSGLLLGDI